MGKIRPIYYCLALLLLSSAVIALDAVRGSVEFSPDGLKLFNVTVKKDDAGKQYYTLTDVSYESNQHPFITDFILSFNKPSDALVSDDTRRYPVTSASYKYVQNNSTLGKGAAFFFKQEHGVELATSKKLWLSNTEDLGSFSIEFRFCPYALKNDSILFSRIGYNSGIRNGIEIILENKKIIARLYGVFTNNLGKRIDIALTKGKPLRAEKWYHYALSYDRISGKLTHYIDEEEIDTVYATDSGEPYNGIMLPSFNSQDLPVVQIGKNYYGYLDEYRIAFRKFEDLSKVADIASRYYKKLQVYGRIPFNKEGVITSPVYEFSHTGTKVTLFSWEQVLATHTFIWFEFRIADRKFTLHDDSCPWVRIKNQQRNIYLHKINEEYLRGKYYQWRAHFVASPDGKHAPVMSNIALQYELDTAPTTPMFLEVVETGDKYITLRWKKNVDQDVYGYNIYYGVQAKQYNGIIRFTKDKRIAADPGKGNYIYITIDNTIIDENLKRDNSGVLNYPLMKNNILYFFAVSAYDSYKIGTRFNHESSLSNEVSARPIAGSQINYRN